MQLASNLLGVISQILLPRVDEPGRVMACELMFAMYESAGLVK